MPVLIATLLGSSCALMALLLTCFVKFRRRSSPNARSSDVIDKRAPSSPVKTTDSYQAQVCCGMNVQRSCARHKHSASTVVAAHDVQPAHDVMLVETRLDCNWKKLPKATNTYVLRRNQQILACDVKSRYSVTKPCCSYLLGEIKTRSQQHYASAF